MRREKLAKLAVITVSLSVYYTVLACLALFTSPEVVYSVSAAPLPDKISFCTNDRLLEQATVAAVKEWETALKILSIKYLWLPNLKVSFAVNENPCTVHVSWADLPQPYLAYTRYNTTYVSKQVEETRLNTIMKHEVARVLGLTYAEPLTITGMDYMPAAVSSNVAKVTTYDVYAVYSKLSGAYGVVTPPKYIPYHSVEDPRQDIVAAFLAFAAYAQISRKLERKHMKG